MDRVRADLRQLDALNIKQQAIPLVGTPRRRVVSSTERGLLKQATSLAAELDPGTGFVREPIKIATHAPAITVLPPSKVPIGMAARGKTDFTLATGLNVDAFAVIGPVLQAGIYGSTTPELGVFLSVGGGWWTNVGVAIGPVITAIFGPPSDLAGVAFGIGCDVRFMVGSIGGLILFSAPPFRFLGFAIGLAVGPTAIPSFDVTVQVTNTFTRPLLK
jgi:hypothetical protein